VAQLALGVIERLEAAEAVRADVQRDATFEQRREDERDDVGDLRTDPHGAGAQDLMVALGHFAEQDDGTIQNTNGELAIRRKARLSGQSAEATDKQVAINELRNHYMIREQDDRLKLGDIDIDHDTLLDLSSADSRIRALDNLIQNDANDPNSENTCAAASLLGAGILGGGERGTEGIEILLDAMMTMGPESRERLEGNDERPGVLSEIRKKIAAGEQLNTGDMHTMQRELYNELQAKEFRDANERLQAVNADPNATDEERRAASKAADAAAGGGIQNTTLQSFIHGSPHLKKMMQENEMGISYIYNNPNSKESSHAVLSIGRGEDGARSVYDPQLRDDGQMVTDRAEVENYRLAEARYVGA
jgi:hypothetical protein